MCYLEIYNELLFDLLELTTQPQDVTIHEDGGGRVRLQGLRCCEVTSEAQALQLLFEVGSSILAQVLAAAAAAASIHRRCLIRTCSSTPTSV